MKIGVLSVQGDFAEHIAVLNTLGVQTKELRQKADLAEKPDGIVLPGGESTAMGKIMRDTDMLKILKGYIADGVPVFATCAGMILLAKKIVNDDTVHFGCMDITVRRNAYGRQLGSFSTEAEFKGIGRIPAVFIRAPYIEECGEKAEALCSVDGKIVAARQNNMLAMAFHPELCEDTSVYRYFLNMTEQYIKTKQRRGA